MKLLYPCLQIHVKSIFALNYRKVASLLNTDSLFAMHSLIYCKNVLILRRRTEASKEAFFIGNNTQTALDDSNRVDLFKKEFLLTEYFFNI